MSAMPQPERSPQNKQLDPIAKFHEAYSIALIDAQMSAEHTATDGWQKLYAGQRRTEREFRRKLADDMRNIADRLEIMPLDDDGIKEIAALKTACSDLNDASAVFDQQTISPVREPAERCQRIIDEAMHMARMEEERHPLVNTGLEEMMRMQVGQETKVRWEDDLGRVVIQ